MMGGGNAKRTIPKPPAAQLTAEFQLLTRERAAAPELPWLLPSRAPDGAPCRTAGPGANKTGKFKVQFLLSILLQHHKAEKLYVEGCL